MRRLAYQNVGLKKESDKSDSTGVYKPLLEAPKRSSFWAFNTSHGLWGFRV